MLKKELRKHYKNKRKLLPENSIEDLSLKIANNLIELSIWNKTYYHLFLTIEEQKEVQSEHILNILHAKDKEVVISKSDFKTNTLTNYLLTDNTKLRKNEYNIPEPVDGIEVPDHKIEVVFIPLLAFDKKGNRVGYGKGFYDKMLSNCKADCIKIGISFFEATNNDILDKLETDIPLDFCVTPIKTYKF